MKLYAGYRMLPEGIAYVPPDFPAGLHCLKLLRWFKIIRLLEARQVATCWRQCARHAGLKYLWRAMAWLLISTEGINRKLKAKNRALILSFLEFRVKKLEVQLHLLGWDAVRLN